MSERFEAKTNDTLYVDRQVLHTEYVASLKNAANDPGKLGSMLKVEESRYISNHNKSDNDSRGDVYAGFLNCLLDMHDGAITHEDVRQDRKLAVFSKEEEKMLEFTDKHFDQLSALSDDSAKKKIIDQNDLSTIFAYPSAHLPKDSNYVQDFANNTGWVGAAVGTGVEVATAVMAPPIAISTSYISGAGAGGFMTFLKADPVGGFFAGAATAVAWGPIVGGLAGYGIGRTIAEPYWNLTQGRKINKLFTQMNSSIPTYEEFSANNATG